MAASPTDTPIVNSTVPTTETKVLMENPTLLVGSDARALSPAAPVAVVAAEATAEGVRTPLLPEEMTIRKIISELQNICFLRHSMLHHNSEQMGNLSMYFANVLHNLVVTIMRPLDKNFVNQLNVVCSLMFELGVGESTSFNTYVALKLLELKTVKDVYFVQTDRMTCLVYGKLSGATPDITTLLSPENADVYVIDASVNLITTISEVLKSDSLKEKLTLKRGEDAGFFKFPKDFIEKHKSIRSGVQTNMVQYYSDKLPVLLGLEYNMFVTQKKAVIPFLENGWVLTLPLKRYYLPGDPLRFNFDYCINANKAVKYLYTVFASLNLKNHESCKSVILMLNYIIKNISMDVREKLLFAQMPRPVAQYFYARSLVGQASGEEVIKKLKEVDFSTDAEAVPVGIKAYIMQATEKLRKTLGEIGARAPVKRAAPK